ncbi:MAG: NAD(P)-dependent oxidoreductase [Mariprofundaceae bacterium]|nr:NAD(P)-dependent oxidoreductase [Mariprofundaceae bacterium]
MMKKNSTISFIGTGSMGRPMIFKLLDQGYPVSVYDKYKATSNTVIDAGAIWKESSKLVAEGADIVFTCLPLPGHVLENMLGEDGALAGMKKGATWIDCSTTDYHNTKRIADIAAQKGIFSLEAPVSNLSHMGVDFGNVSFYVGEIGMGQTVKLLTNILFYSAMIAWGEVLVLARTHHIPLHFMWDYTKKSQGNYFVTEQMTPFFLTVAMTVPLL